MNVRPEMIRQQSGMPHLPNSMLTLNGMNNINPSQFFPQSVPQQPGHQTQGQPGHVPLLSNNGNPNPAAMGMLGGGQPAPSAGGPGLYPLQLQAANNSQRQNFLQPQNQGPTGGINPNVGPGPSHMNGVGPNGIPGYPNAILQQNPLRRTMPPQQQPLRQTGPQMGGMHSGQQMGGVGGMGGMAMNPQAGMGGQLRPGQPPPHMGIRMAPQGQIPGQMPLGGQMQLSTDIQMSLRQPQLQGNTGIAGHIARAPSQPQPMQNLGQSPSLTTNHTGSLPPDLQRQQFPNPMNPQQQHPGLGSSPHVTQHHTGPNMQGNVPGAGTIPSQNSGNRMTPEQQQMFINFQNQNVNQGGPRLTGGPAATFPFVSPAGATPPNQLGGNEVSQPRPGGTVGTPGVPTNMTPAQALELTQGQDGYPFGNMTPSHHQPPRPPSQQRGPHGPFSIQPPSQPQQQQLPAQRSPRQPLAQHVQPHRPQSQPQAPQGHSPQQSGPARTPRMAQLSLNPGMARVPLVPSVPAPPQPASQPAAPPAHAVPRPPSSSPAQGAQRPPIAPPAAPPLAPPPSAATSALSAPPATQPQQHQHQHQHQHQQQPQAQPQQQPTTGGPQPPPPQQPLAGSIPPQTQHSMIPRAIPIPTYIVGQGQGLIRLLQFSGVLADENKQKLQLQYWESLVKEYFKDKASFKLTLWKDNLRNEAKPFEIEVPILPRFFLVTSQSGVKSMSLTLNGARERLNGMDHAVVECVQAHWTYKYTNGYTVTLRGPLTAHVRVVPGAAGGGHPFVLKFDQIQFDANYHDKLISVDAITGLRPEDPHDGIGTPVNGPDGMMQRRTEEDDTTRHLIGQASVPSEPVNAFGIPQATMRCLELAESVGQMSDLIQYANENKLGPMDALKQYAQKLREGSGGHPLPNGVGGPPPPGAPGSGFGPPNTSPIGMYPPAPGFPQLPQQQGPQNAPIPDGTPQQSKAVPPQSQSSTSASTPGPTVSTPAASTPGASTMTPAMPAATLKRKSPTIGIIEQAPPSKRPARSKRK